MAAEDAGMMEELESTEPLLGMPQGVPLTPAPKGLKVRAACEAKRDGGCRANLRDNLSAGNPEVLSAGITGGMMRVGRRYVEYALRLQREAPALFEQLHAGTITMQAAMKTLTGEIDDARRQEIKAARSEFNRALRSPDRYPDFLQRFREFMAQFQE